MSTTLVREAPPEVETPTVEESPELKVLKQARELLSDQSRWCTGAFALNPAGHAVTETSPYAVKWCASGAIRLFSSRAGLSPAAVREPLRMKLGQLVSWVNDGPDGYRRIMEGLDSVIAEKEKT